MSNGFYITEMSATWYYVLILPFIIQAIEYKLLPNYT